MVRSNVAQKKFLQVKRFFRQRLIFYSLQFVILWCPNSLETSSETKANNIPEMIFRLKVPFDQRSIFEYQGSTHKT